MSANMKMSIDCKIVYKLNEKKILKYNIEMVKLEDYTTGELKKMISSFNKIVKFVGYSKKKKAELITMIRTHPKVKVEEGANAVKLSIKTDEDFEKQKKVKKEKVKKEVKKEVEKLDDVKVVVKPVKEEPLTVTKADGTKKVLKMKPKKKEPVEKKEEELIDNWGKDANNIYLEQNYKNMTEGIRKLINKKGSLNIDGLFQFLKKDSIINKLFMKYSIQKVLNGFKNYVEYLDDEGNKEIGQYNLNDYFTYDEDGRIKSTFRGKDLNSNVLDKMKDTWTKTNSYNSFKPEKKEEPKKEEPKKEEPKEEKNEQELYREQKKELDEKTLNMILKEDKDILLKPSEVDDPNQSKKIKKLYKKVFETYKKSYGDLLDKYDFSKSNYRKNASNNFNLFIRRARLQPKKAEPKKEEEKKDKLLNRLVATARSHAKNGISVEGLKDFFNNVQEYKKTNPPKLQSQLAGVLYNFLNNNIQMGKKKLPNNMNNALKELGYKEIKK